MWKAVVWRLFVRLLRRVPGEVRDRVIDLSLAPSLWMLRVLKALPDHHTARWRLYRAGLVAGYHVIPTHFYASEPDILTLEETKEHWATPLSLPGLPLDIHEQAATLRRMCLPYRSEYSGAAAFRHAESAGWGLGYGEIESEALHGVLRSVKPRRIIEVGSGVSTFCSLAALRLNEEESETPARVTCIEPYPSARLLQAAEDGLLELIGVPVQDVPVESYDVLGPGDVLFIDSSHAVKVAGDVTHLILEVLPRLKPGVLVHVHDVNLPYEYQPDFLTMYFHWNEPALLAAYLSDNPRWQILFALSVLHHGAPQVLQEVFPDYVPHRGERGLRLGGMSAPGHFPSSLWMEMIGPGSG